MIISASYKTDIPTFYGEWFINRLNAGYCLMVHPFDRRRVRTVSLHRKDVDAFVFWTKNLGPFFPALKIVAERSFPFMIQYTINAYPRKLEFSVTDPVRSIQHVLEVAAKYGPGLAVWRYDPIIFSTETPVEQVLDNFDWIARKLSGAVDEVVVSFAQLYQKTLRNMDVAAREFGFSWKDPSDDEKRSVLKSLLRLAREHKLRLTLCSQPDLLTEGVDESRCVDADRLEKLFGVPKTAALRGSRKECGCYASVDIGDYDTCPHGCVYCYAVRNRKLAQKRYKQHDPNGEFLFTTEQAVAASVPPLFSTAK
jgi:hypothetical protein